MTDTPRRIQRRLGPAQIEALASVCGVRRVCLTPMREDRSLIKRGLLRADESGACCITPDGLRALADALEAGRLEDGLTAWARMGAKDGKRND